MCYTIKNIFGELMYNLSSVRQDRDRSSVVRQDPVLVTFEHHLYYFGFDSGPLRFGILYFHRTCFTNMATSWQHYLLYF